MMADVTQLPRLVVLSPHLDDAVLSVGALIARAAASGRTVEVWTAFTDGPPPEVVPPRLRRFADYPTRLAEDDAALALLGAGHRRLGLSERLWRSPAPGGSLVGGLRAAFRTPRGRNGFQELDTLAELVTHLLADPDTEVLAPLGVGNHVDHVEVLLAVLLASARTKALSRLGFYEDFYALADAARRRHPVTRQRSPTRWPSLLRSPGWAAPVEGAVLRAAPLIAAGPPIERYLPELTDLVWQCEPQPVAPAEEERKLEAVAQYRSQIPALGGIRRLGPLLRRSHRVRGGELIWRAHPG
jgi:LmbE family N-acetylglucosaminyl deacetylase